MLTPIEKILFAIATVVSLYYTYRGVQRIAKNISGGQGKVEWSLAWKRIGDLIAKVIFSQPVFRFRLGPSILHAFVGWGFFIYWSMLQIFYTPIRFQTLDNTGLWGCLQMLQILGRAPD